MKFYQYIVIILSFAIFGCDSKSICDDTINIPIEQSSLRTDRITNLLVTCGGLDTLDIEIIQGPYLTKVVNSQDLLDKKYTLSRLINEFNSFKKDSIYILMHQALIYRDKKVDSKAWQKDSLELVQLFNYSEEEMKIMKKIVFDNQKKDMTYSEAFKETNKILIQKIVNEIIETK